MQKIENITKTIEINERTDNKFVLKYLADNLLLELKEQLLKPTTDDVKYNITGKLIDGEPSTLILLVLHKKKNLCPDCYNRKVNTYLDLFKNAIEEKLLSFGIDIRIEH